MGEKNTSRKINDILLSCMLVTRWAKGGSGHVGEKKQKRNRQTTVCARPIKCTGRRVAGERWVKEELWVRGIEPAKA